jgi:hypothetical protein
MRGKLIQDLLQGFPHFAKDLPFLAQVEGPGARVMTRVKWRPGVL